MIKFIKPEEFPEDPYIKELVYIEIDEKFRIAYVPRIGKNGNKFWQPLSAGITRNGKREYFKAIEFNSKFLEKEIQDLLNSEPWKCKAAVHNQKQPENNYTQGSFLEECPF
jgi:hypothetical protein